MIMYEKFISTKEMLQRLIDDNDKEIIRYYTGKKVKISAELLEELELESDDDIVWTIYAVTVFDDCLFFDVEHGDDDLQDLEIDDLIFL
ncbi:hypothetical protein CPT_Muenster_159 [Klebsiella phage Muenster]|nr:hypothetical protein CPT_Muenster_159 [Klebsiella phage Muenster]